MPLIRSDLAKYWEIPDGTNCVQKAWLTGRVGAAVGLIGSIFHIILKETSPALKAVQVATASTVTMATVGAVFGLTTCFSAQIREKPEDPLNYFIGGCTSGMIFGARAHSFTTGTGACVGLGLLAAFTKISKKEGWKFAPPPQV
ncbi:PREDICTED: NADH dehydrogenase [ubiquinone] 1 alpha subcomplex subunit 11 [Crocodylus porosus]|uniref:NADH dehydrogenase [ubiquinone] 1 alpha subcomplex subunit 11 n=1 Tax=Crocodylus porosus TaxID=8502 RepID=A0A7M4F3C4_CROPO|nr:PREDICTED: NADH dehydrogenase [ubiquinone] 1 alpha subcomplex subunit 11 [Crocodylus porosus]